MLCSQCARRVRASKSMWCVTCGLAQRVRYLETTLQMTRIDYEASKRAPRVIAAKPVTLVERLDAEITRCRLCDQRYLPDFGHHCARKKEVAA